MSNFLSRISSENKTSIMNVLLNNKDLNVDNFVIIENTEKLKSFGYDEWYKNSVDPSQGIWLGNGISDQFVLKLLSTPRELRLEIPENFGYVVKNGKAVLVKIIEE